jgi:hypothetical protein
MTALSGRERSGCAILSGAKDLLPVWGRPPPAVHVEQTSPAPQTLSIKNSLITHIRPLPSPPHYSVYTLVPQQDYNSFSEILHD